MRGSTACSTDSTCQELASGSSVGVGAPRSSSSRRPWKTPREASPGLVTRRLAAIFRALGMPTAPRMIVRSQVELEQAARTVGFPYVSKPRAHGRSRGVTTYIRDHGHLLQGFREPAIDTPGSIMIERHVEGEVHRMIVVRVRLGLLRAHGSRCAGFTRRPCFCQSGHGPSRQAPRRRLPYRRCRAGAADARRHAGRSQQSDHRARLRMLGPGMEGSCGAQYRSTGGDRRPRRPPLVGRSGSATGATASTGPTRSPLGRAGHQGVSLSPGLIAVHRST